MEKSVPFDHHIPDINTYNTSMQKSMIDKMFFMDKVDAVNFVDFGCADGTLIKHLSKMFPEYTYQGYDISEEMINLASENVPTAHFTTNWNEIAFNEKPTCLILSSIIHEIFSYLNPTEIEEFWNKVWNSGFDYVVIRDMMVSEKVSRESDPVIVARIRQLFDRKQLTQWEAQWGSINENWSLVHFLLTYRYQTNWDRELVENYLPHSVEKFLTYIPKEYHIQYIEHYTLPFIRQQVRKDFNIDLQDRTHLKLILKNATV